MQEGLLVDIYGARRRILFVEGTEESLDKPLYGVLFPDVTVIPKGNCREVERAAIGMRGASGLHWIQAYGLVDADGRNDSDLERLQCQGIFAIDCYSVESLYYHPDMIMAIAKRVEGVDGSNPDDRVRVAISNSIAAIRPHKNRLCFRVASRKLHEHVLGSIPTVEEITAGEDISVAVPVKAALSHEHSVFDGALEAGDFLKLLQRYPLRETAALAKTAESLGFRSRKEYEAAVLKACSDSEDVKGSVRAWLGTLARTIDDESSETIAS